MSSKHSKRRNWEPTSTWWPSVIVHRCFCAVLLLCFASSLVFGEAKLVPHTLHLANGKEITLSLPSEYEISIAAEGLKRVRFLAPTPDGRMFVTGLYTRADNSRGAISILDGFDTARGRFTKVTTYLDHLRNPNSIAFYAAGDGKTWLYVALTDKLERFRFTSGATAPEGAPEVLAHYPDYGLNYKYGGWHLTRTLAFGTVAGKARLFVTVGSSCNACREKEEIRATLTSMNPDGSDARIIGSGLRNAVGLRWVDGALYATNMGADHLGNDAPDDTMLRLSGNALSTHNDYGWPNCYFHEGRAFPDPEFVTGVDACSKVGTPFGYFPAHSSPLGLEYLDATFPDPQLKEHWLVALHGSGKKHLGRGYAVEQLKPGGKPETFLSGFLQAGVVHGRPCDVMRFGKDALLVTDDYAGAIYLIRLRH